MKPEIVVVTGSRDWTDADAIDECLDNHPEGTILLHGGCRGADAYTATSGKARKFVLWEFPYFEENGREARNASMVGMAAGLQIMGHRVTCYAFPLEGGRGTQKCMALMRKCGLRIANWEKQ